ncbi:MAG: CysE/LacA/LpxA/NodL family acetyltransferase [Ignavibacteria bacterium]|nr:CysE/LacA/LpxA/NodL family acetyltransferase [Ignavibacteria bacterium]
MKTESGNNASLISFRGLEPRIHPSVFLCEGVRIIGDVEIGQESSVWYNTIIRGDVHYVRIGERTNIQDLSMLHVTNGKYPLNIGSDITIAHSVTVHGATLRDGCFIGMGACVLDGADIGSNSLIAAGTVVRENFIVPEGVMVAGVPGKIIKELNDEDIARMRYSVQHYLDYVRQYRGK